MTVKKPPTKSELREQLRKEMRSYLEKGGKVEKIPGGVSGRHDNAPLKTVLFDGPKEPEPRTYVTNVIAEIDARRRPIKVPATKKRPRGHYKTIFDDFGEPIRKIWVEE